MININDRVALDETELQFEFVRASGPGGQNVNKVSTAVRLKFDVAGSPSLPEDIRKRLIRLAGKKVGADGFLTIHARARRTQEANRRDAIDRLADLVQKATEPPRPRRATRPTHTSRKQRLEAKRHRGQVKERRRSLEAYEE
jgi:ribosome-associated protein